MGGALREAAFGRGDLTDSEWRILNPLLPDRGEHGPAVTDKRRTVNGILCVLRTAAPWRDVPRRHGNESLLGGPRKGSGSIIQLTQSSSAAVDCVTTNVHFAALISCAPEGNSDPVLGTAG